MRTTIHSLIQEAKLKRRLRDHNRDPLAAIKPSDTFKAADGSDYAKVRSSTVADLPATPEELGHQTHGRPVLKFTLTFRRANGTKVTKHFTSTLALSENRVRDIVRDSPGFEHAELRVRLF